MPRAGRPPSSTIAASSPWSAGTAASWGERNIRPTRRPRRALLTGVAPRQRPRALGVVREIVVAGTKPGRVVRVLVELVRGQFVVNHAHHVIAGERAREP